MSKKKSKLNGILKCLLIIVSIVIIIAAVYVVYVFASYHRIGNMSLTPDNPSGNGPVSVGKEYKIVSYNIGFGAYESDYGFFMDGGTESWAWSKDRLSVNLNNIASVLEKERADLYLVQEVDTNSTRSYHVDERDYIKMNGKSSVFAQNYDSPFLQYPLLKPHGASKSGIMTFSSFTIDSAERIELPVESGFSKLLDLDRCYSKCRIKTDGNNEFVLYNFHLSAYTSDGKIATEQLKMVIDDMESEYSKGNYCVAGGDFNKDILGDSSVYFGKGDKEYTWAQPIPEGIFDGKHLTLEAPLDKNDPVPSCRNADGPYHKGQFVLTIDGFIVSENVEVISSEVVNTEFTYSDHNPVSMIFKLKG